MIRLPTRAEAQSAGNKLDPYRGLRSKGRTGASYRAKLQADAFAKTKLGKRNARGRAISNPMLNDVRRLAFDQVNRDLANVVGSQSTRLAMAVKSARRAIS